MSVPVTYMILGANGQVGSEVKQLLKKEENIRTIFVDREELDLTQVDTIFDFVCSHTPDIVINCAAYTNVEGAEDQPQEAEIINAHAPRELAHACAHIDIPLVHISTDFVFGDMPATPITEQAAKAPKNVYGLSKSNGEDAIIENCPKHIIVRTSSVFGRFGANFVKTMLRLGQKYESLRVIADQHSCPTSAITLAQSLLCIAEKVQKQTTSNIWGIYHLCNPTPTTWFEFAKEIFRCAADQGIPLLVKEVIPIETHEYPLKAARPPYSVLECTKIIETFDLSLPTWQQELEVVLSHIKDKS